MVSLTSNKKSHNNSIKFILGEDKKIFASAVVRLYFAEKNSKQWKRINESASTLTFYQNEDSGVLYFSLINLNEESSEWNQEIYLDFRYFKEKDYFHSFEGEKGMFGILFADPTEADEFYKVLMDHLESYTSANKLPSKTKTKSRSIFGAFSFGRKSSSKNQESEEELETKSKDKKKDKKKKEKQKDSDLGHDDVSEPRDFTHLSHIGFNPTKGTFDIQNIPNEWKTLFAKAGITQDQLENKSTAEFIAGFVQDSEPQMKEIKGNTSKTKPPVPVPLKKKAPPPPPPASFKGKKAISPNKTSSSVQQQPPPPPPKKSLNKQNATNDIPSPPPIPINLSNESSGPSSNAHNALLQSIKGAGIGILKPVDKQNHSNPQSPVTTSNPHSALMASIKGGTNLRPASKIDRSASSPTSSVASTDPTDMMAAMLAKALAARNKKLAAESSDEDENSDDSRW